MNKSSHPVFPLKFPFLLIETLAISLLIGLAMVTLDLTNEWIYVIEGVLLVLTAVFVKLSFSRGEASPNPERTALRDDMDKMDLGILTVRRRRLQRAPSKTYEDRPDPVSLDVLRRPGSRNSLSPELADNVWKAFLVAAIGLLFFAGYEAEVALIRHLGQWAFLWALLFAAYIGIFLGFMHLIRNPRVTTSRIFDVYINMGALLFGIPFGTFFLFILGAVTILMFLPAGTDPQQALVPFVLVALIGILVLQAFYLVSTMKKYAAERGLSLSEYIRLKLSGKERELEKLGKLANQERIDSLYEKIPEIKSRIRPAAATASASYSTRSLDDYEYAKKEKHPFFAFLREFVPAILGIIVANTLLIIGFLALAALVGR